VFMCQGHALGDPNSRKVGAIWTIAPTRAGSKNTLARASDFRHCDYSMSGLEWRSDLQRLPRQKTPGDLIAREEPRYVRDGTFHL
jgi:hypothetical protein